MTYALRLAAVSLLACVLGCEMVAGIERKHLPLEADDELCSDYCQVVDEHCRGDYQVYHDPKQCAFACKELPPSSREGSENSIECRLQVAASISSEQTDCAGAGPGGGGPGGANVCGTNCESYCQLMSQACAKPEFRGYWLGDVKQCIAACQGIRDRGKDEANTGSTSLYSAADDGARDHFGDTVQCRLFHAVAASAPQADTNHCWHAALSPHARAEVATTTNPCMAERGQKEASCSDYCRLVMVACPGDLKVYDSEPQCSAGCTAAFPAGSITDARPPDMTTHVNSLGCRYTHAYNALVAAPANHPQHCGHASPSGDGVCGGACESYCYQLTTTCPNEAKAKGDRAQCEAECKAWGDPTDMPYSLKLAASGTSQVACRLHALTEARDNAGKADVLKAKCELAASKRPCQ